MLQLTTPVSLNNKQEYHVYSCWQNRLCITRNSFREDFRIKYLKQKSRFSPVISYTTLSFKKPSSSFKYKSGQSLSLLTSGGLTLSWRNAPDVTRRMFSVGFLSVIASNRMCDWRWICVICNHCVGLLRLYSPKFG